MMNKQEIDNLIANNSIRQTNREWLESLSDEELVWLLDWSCILDNICGIYFADAPKRVEDWLRAER